MGNPATREGHSVTEAIRVMNVECFSIFVPSLPQQRPLFMLISVGDSSLMKGIEGKSSSFLIRFLELQKTASVAADIPPKAHTYCFTW